MELPKQIHFDAACFKSMFAQTASEKKEILHDETTWTTLENIMSSENNQIG